MLGAGCGVLDVSFCQLASAPLSHRNYRSLLITHHIITSPHYHILSTSPWLRLRSATGTITHYQ